MTIRINQIAVDFTLEHEATYAELTTSLRAWANAQNLAILGLLADGKALAPDDSTPLETIQTVEVEAVPAGEQDLARAAVLSRYFSLLCHAARTNDNDLVDELRHEYSSAKSAVAPLLAPFGPRLQVPLMCLEGSWAVLPEVAQAALHLAEASEMRRRELQNPALAVQETLELLMGALKNSETLASLFQQGKDGDALQLILQALTLWEDLVRRSSLVEVNNQESWMRLQEELQPLLLESETALKASDSILVTDLFEYEIAPRLKTAVEHFPSFLNLDPVTEVL